MDVIGAAAVVVIFFVVAIGIWLAAMSMDKSRITDYVESNGGRIISISWAPFGTGWFGSKNERIYEVVYYDANGDQHWATCKTSLFSGVYWTDDRVSHRKAPWYDGLPKKNEPHDPIIRHIPRPHSTECIVGEARESTNATIDAEIARLRAQIAELERKKQRQQT